MTSRACSVLKQYFGYDSFRPGQERLIDAVLSGRDVLGILPTGGGKSLCYQVPALMLRGTALVISPLISLMNDQVGALIRRGIPAALLTSEQSPFEREQVMRRAGGGRLRLLYVSPERLRSPAFRSEAVKWPISLIALDEAHCISEWGEEFRPAYREIPAFLALLPARPPVAAFTATAAPAVREDIIRYAGLRDPFTLTTGFDRPNLFFAVRRAERRDEELLSLLAERRGSAGIVYCLTRAAVDDVTGEIVRRGIPAVRYHAGLSDAEKLRAQNAWLSGKVPLIVATNAFGMGIDKPDVRFVIHYNLPLNLENYYQEAGRAGRDGKESECLLLTNDQDIRIGRFFIGNTKSAELRTKMERDFRAMRVYAGGRGCLRAHVLRYFGEDAPDYCGKCSFCAGRTALPARADQTFDQGLYRSLAAVRLRIAEKRRVQPWKIIPNQMLRAISERKPERMSDLMAMEGISPVFCIKYGADFLTEIRTWVQSH